MSKIKILSFLFVFVLFASPAFSYTSSYTGAEIDKAIQDVRAGIGSQGVQWDENADSYTRTGSISDVAVSQSAGDSRLIIQSAMRRCVLNDSGEVVYYLDANDSTLTEFGAASDLTGGDGQVMVEIPKFYYKYSYSGTTHSWSISPNRLPGYNLHPAFYKNGAEVDYRYIGAYEGVGYDDSTSAYFDGDDVGDSPTTNWPGGTAINTGTDLLASVTGYAPLVNETRDEFRSIAGNRGTGWRQLDYDLASAIQLLYLIEYADWHSQNQNMIGMGRTQLTGGTWAAGSYIGETGLSNSDGDGTNAVAYSGDADDAGAENAYMTYRGIENFYGNVWSWVDGINIYNNQPEVSNNDANWTIGSGATFPTANYIDLNITLPSSNGWQTTLEQISRGFLPSALTGSSSTYITDYYYQNTGWRVAMLGGNADDGSKAGVAGWNLAYDSSVDSVSIGGRLAY